MTTVHEAFYELLRAAGMTTVFGNPGSTELPLLDGFPEDFRYILGLQEAAAVAMADGYAQATGRPALVVLHTAAGTGNGMGSIINAGAANSPLVIIAGQQAREMIKTEAVLTNVGGAELPKPAVKGSYEAARPEDVPAAVARAIQFAQLPPRGPVFVSIPQDDWTATVDGDAMRQLRVRAVVGRTAPDPMALETLATRLRTARNPVLVIGSDVDAADAHREAVALAERARMPVWLAPMPSRWGFPSDHPYFRGVLPSGIRTLAEKLAGHDLVLSVGTPVFRYMEYLPGPQLPPGADLVAITSSPDEAARATMGDAIIADPKLALAALLRLVPASDRAEPTGREKPQAVTDETDQLSPEGVFETLNSSVPPDTVMVNESTSNVWPFWERVSLTPPGGYYFPGAGGLGFGLAGAVGVQLADPSRPVIGVMGDGAVHYGATAFWSARHHGIPVTWLVLRNGEYGALKNLTGLMGVHDIPGLELSGLDTTAVATAYGVESVLVHGRDELAAALKRAVAADTPQVVEVPVFTRSPYA
ncbi:benzoylformate decarboxylase [Nocardia sp. NPDC051030]|uniref:benzoylformate decarboxylase n=1 Tax=Nocardia sp. NPDC051030 TaxID=3155162 RepID=UPI003441E387